MKNLIEATLIGVIVTALGVAAYGLAKICRSPQDGDYIHVPTNQSQQDEWEKERQKHLAEYDAFCRTKEGTVS